MTPYYMIFGPPFQSIKVFRLLAYLEPFIATKVSVSLGKTSFKGDTGGVRYGGGTPPLPLTFFRSVLGTDRPLRGGGDPTFSPKEKTLFFFTLFFR